MLDSPLFWSALGALAAVGILLYNARAAGHLRLPKWKRQPSEDTTPSPTLADEDEAPTSDQSESESRPEWTHDDAPTAIFNDRIAAAFPGERGLVEISDRLECVKRLEVLLRPPLMIPRASPIGGSMDHVWWFRGLSSNPIRSFRRLSDQKCLMDHFEVVPRRLVAYRTDAYWRQFVYLEMAAEKPIGLYDWTLRQLEERTEQYGCATEEFGIFEGTPITRTQYDDRGAVIDGEVVDTRGAELRIRYLSTCNLLICAKFNPLNATELDNPLKRHLSEILEGEADVGDLVELLQHLLRHRQDQ